MLAVSAPAADDAASLSNSKNTSTSTKSKLRPLQPTADNNPWDKDFALTKCTIWCSVEPEIEEIPLNQFGNEIVDDLPGPAVCDSNMIPSQP